MNRMSYKIYVIAFFAGAVIATIILSFIALLLIKMEVAKISSNIKDIKYTLDQWELTK